MEQLPSLLHHPPAPPFTIAFLAKLYWKDVRSVELSNPVKTDPWIAWIRPPLPPQANGPNQTVHFSKKKSLSSSCPTKDITRDQSKECLTKSNTTRLTIHRRPVSVNPWRTMGWTCKRSPILNAFATALAAILSTLVKSVDAKALDCVNAAPMDGVHEVITPCLPIVWSLNPFKR